jgi:hypothetical protein
MSIRGTNAKGWPESIFFNRACLATGSFPGQRNFRARLEILLLRMPAARDEYQAISRTVLFVNIRCKNSRAW